MLESAHSPAKPQESTPLILVCYHKFSTPIIASEILRPIIVGAANIGEGAKALQEKLESKLPKNLRLGEGQQILLDSSGDNISHLNPHFCELTAMYWAWKNVDSSYYGLFHYRRVLDFSGKVKRSKQFDVNRVSVKPRDIVRKFRLDKRIILAELEKSPIILAQPMVVPLGFETSQGVSQYDIYARDHRKRDLDIVIDIIRAKFPHLVESMEAVLFTPGVQLSWCNMFVMRKDLYQEYCEFLFGVLLEAHGKIDLSGYNPYQSRIYGFIAERLLNVFVYHKIFYARIQPIYKHHFVLREPKPLFGSVATGDTRRFYLCGIRIRKSKIQT